MCRRIECAKCGRPTYAGCGAHVERVLANVSVPERCHCRKAPLETPELQAKREQQPVRK